jgi:hypothetical protein
VAPAPGVVPIQQAGMGMMGGYPAMVSVGLGCMSTNLRFRG